MRSSTFMQENELNCRDIELPPLNSSGFTSSLFKSQQYHYPRLRNTSSASSEPPQVAPTNQ